jgi:Protein of unknown function (DUF2950)
MRIRILGLLGAGSLALTFTAAAQSTPPQAPTAKPVAQAKPVPQMTFETPQQAADALIAAASAFDVAALKSIFGAGGRDLLVTGDPVQDKNRAEEFATRARERKTVTVDPSNPNRAILAVGSNDWPLPVPIVRQGRTWSFDARAGREEILNRRIGGNELDAIETCRGYVEAQHEYALTKRDASGVNQYAQRILSTPGKQDGLAWQNADGSWDGPIGEAVARAIEQGYSARPEPYNGYYFKVLTGQGPAAPLGEMDFVIKGVMIGGFALIAAPAEYGVSGVQTFIVSHDGVVYQKDLGPNTLNIAKTIQRFNPDKSWTPVTGG